MSAGEKKRNPTKYPGVYYRFKTNRSTGKQEKIFYISYRLRKDDGGWKKVEESVGGHGMTPAKASHVRTRRLRGEELPNKERRAQAMAAKLKRTWTVSNLWEEYKAANPGLKSLPSYESLYRLYVAPEFGDKKPKDISPFDIERLTRRMKGKSAKTIASALELLRRIVHFGIKKRECPGPGFIIELPRVNNVKTEDLTPEELARLLEVIDRHIKQQTSYLTGCRMMKLVLLTGMRRGEMFKLKWDDINWHRINITLEDPKSGMDQTIPMNSYTVRLLKTIEEEKSGSKYVFPGKSGGQLTDVKRQVNRIKAEAELPADFRPIQGLRHVFGTNLGNAGVDRDIIGRLMTHATDRSVTSRYVHYREETLRQAAELAGQLIEDATGENNKGVVEIQSSKRIK